jgi:HEAT repeat protein
VDSVGDSDMDAALASFLNSTSEGDRDALVAFGPRALDRALEVFAHGSDLKPWISGLTVSGRAIADAWGIVIAALSRAFPEEFLSCVEQGDVGLLRSNPQLVVVTLGDLKELGARQMLLRFTDHPDDLIRFHAMKGLFWRDDPDAIAAVERHLDDASPVVRLEALRGVVRRDPSRAERLLAVEIQEGKLPPLLTEQAQTMLATLRSRET